MPSGGVGVNPNGPPPEYRPWSDYDFQSLNLGLNQEWIELDLFHYGLAKFSKQEFYDAGLNDDYQFLIEWMADQEVGHATMFTNMLYPHGAKQCEYQYPFETVREFIDFCQKLTRFGESGTYGFLPHLNNRAPVELIINAITTEARQQMVFRQFEGLFPMALWFVPGIPQAWQWTLLAPYIKSCPKENPHIEWQNFPALTINNNPNATRHDSKAAVSTNVTQLSHPGDEISLTWELPGKTVGPNGSYVTTTSAGPPKFALWVDQINATYTPLYSINGTSAFTKQPDGNVFGDNTAYIWNDTMFIAITDSDPYVTPFNLSNINYNVVAGPAIYQSG
ncbi:Rds1 protein [Coniophora puteana RWD-64-598 SS2]|uniref:Rds1 protein n=1 Tax=Coniophora puteana (strain RWD-64-598) TaxID=741705 RepID=A0A5M3MUC8_CONPW|nr:Rds1 protein [Coniophora puteana RWD-64-598 SS2]EIW82778.1 Rds1 protein [Coniophora puteana RWD-64-598 SS2]